MPARRFACVGLAICVMLAVWLQGCSDDGGPSAPATGSLSLTATYAGSLGAVSAQHPLIANLYTGSNPNAQGDPHASLRAGVNGATLLFTGLSTGSYTLAVFYDVSGDSLQDPSPYELYDGKSFGQAPTLLAITANQTTTASATFGDDFLTDPWQPLPAFALPDSNPNSATFGEIVTADDLAGARAILYIAEQADEPLPDFTLTDVNPNSPTLDQQVPFSSLRGHLVLVYFGYANCGICRGQFGGLHQMVEDLHAEGLNQVTGMMINNPLDAPFAYKLDEIGTPLPALQDTFDVIPGGLRPAVGTLLHCTDGDEFLIVDAEGHLYQEVTVGSGKDYDLRSEDAREEAKELIRAASAASGCTGCGTQYIALETLLTECAAQGIVPLRVCAVNWHAEGCLTEAVLAPLALPFPVLQDVIGGLCEGLSAQEGELLVLDGAGLIRRRATTGACAGRDLDLGVAADRARVIAWLQAIGTTR